MASNIRLIRQDDFTGGLNLRADQFQLAPNESPRMLNVEIDPRGGVFSRGGMKQINSSAVVGNWNPQRIFSFDGSSNYAMLTTGHETVAGVPTDGKVYYSTGGDFAAISNVDVSDIHGASFAPWGTTMYSVTGSSTPSYKWTGGVTATLLSESGPVWQNSYTAPTGGYFPKACLSLTHAGKIFVANTTENGVDYPNRIRWSHPNSPEDWAESDRIDIEDGGEKITGIASFAGHLVIFKPKAVFALFGYDSDTFQIVEVSRNVGSITPHTYVQTERAVYFFSYPEGLMMYDGEKILDLFQPLRPMFDLGFINTLATDSIYVNYINRRVWVSLPYDEDTTVSYPAMCFVYDPSIGQRGSWVQHQTSDGYGFSGGTTFVNDTGNTYYLGVHPVHPHVLNVDQFDEIKDNITGTDEAFLTRYRTRWYDAGTYSQKKMFRRPDIVAKQTPLGGNLEVNVYRDYEEVEGTQIRTYSIDMPQNLTGFIWGASVWGTATWGAPNRGSQLLRGRNMGLCRSVQIEFVGPTGAPWGINSCTFKYSPRRVSV